MGSPRRWVPGPSAALDLFGRVEGSRAWTDRSFPLKYYPCKFFLPSAVPGRSLMLCILPA